MPLELDALIGFVDGCRIPGYLTGWVATGAGGPLIVRLVRNGCQIADAKVELFRPDLSQFCQGKVGFSLQLPEAFAPTELLAADVTVEAVDSASDTAIGRIPIFKGLEEDLKAVVALESIGSQERLAELLRRYGGRTFPALSKASRCLLRGNASRDLPFPSDKALLAPMLVRVGATSFDGRFIIGKHGVGFLVGGTNMGGASNIDEPAIEELVGSWGELISRRSELAGIHDARFIQVLIPEKFSALKSFLPDGLSVSCLPVYRRFVDRLGRSSASVVLDAGPVLESTDPERLTYAKTDSHLSPYGACLLTQEILSFLQLKFDFGDISFDRQMLRTGDMGQGFFLDDEPEINAAHVERLERQGRMPNGTFYELTGIPVSSVLDQLGATLEILRETRNPPFHNGTILSWRSPLAPFGQRVLVFGNSFFGRGTSPDNLSWWFSRLFSECMFVWDYKIDWGLVRDFKPDFLIGQTIERFMVRCPDA